MDRKCLLGIILFVSLYGIISTSAAGCNARKYSEGNIVCVCNRTSCDDIHFEWPDRKGQAIQIESSSSGKRFDVKDLGSIGSLDTKEVTNDIITIRVNLSESHQPILGWGSSATDAAAINIYNLSESVSEKLIESYFGVNGLQYNFIRVPLAGSDFSNHAYTYNDINLDEQEEDLELENWSLKPEDTDFKIPLLQRAQQMCADRDVELDLIAVPWSAPAWMKTNRDLVNGKLLDRDDIYQSYTKYILKFFEAYRNKDLNFWGFSIQNEPRALVSVKVPFNSMEFNTSQTIKFVSEYLGPALDEIGLNRENGFNLLIGDDSLGFVEDYVIETLENPEMAKYFNGFALHWYGSGTLAPYDNLTRLYETIKDKIEFMLMTEGCTGDESFSKTIDLGSWFRGELYALDIIENLLRHTGGWVDWNMALNLKGGPSWINNTVDSPIIVDSENDQFFKQPMYYALGHFSRFFRPGSMRLTSQVMSSDNDDDIKATAVRNDQSGHLIINILNRADTNQTVELLIDGSSSSDLDDSKIRPIYIEAKSLNSILIKL